MPAAEEPSTPPRSAGRPPNDLRPYTPASELRLRRMSSAARQNQKDEAESALVAAASAADATTPDAAAATCGHGFDAAADDDRPE